MAAAATFWLSTAAPFRWPAVVSRKSHSISLSSLAPRRFHMERRRHDLNSIAGLQTANPNVRSWRSAQVKGGGSEGNPITEDMILDEQSLQRDLEIAIKEEDYARAAKLRDKLRILHEDSKASVLTANTLFYHAFKNGDLAAMHSIWAKGDHVYVVHPGAGRISGYDLVMGSWEIVCGADYEFPLQIDLKNVEVHVRGDVGYVTCMEVVKTKGSSWGKQVATNVFERVDGQWFISIHHASHMDS
ncbi:uncharacterized protein [Typha angustifolia]|uniref:uncharacterized protein n=1 Tax=Typha angustifolia TaxID=59011 RepID=UPI003C300A61